jgi:hypothetical protein
MRRCATVEAAMNGYDECILATRLAQKSQTARLPRWIERWSLQIITSGLPRVSEYSIAEK